MLNGRRWQQTIFDSETYWRSLSTHQSKCTDPVLRGVGLAPREMEYTIGKDDISPSRRHLRRHPRAWTVSSI